MADDPISLEYVCAKWAYSELLSAQPYYGSELKPLREKLARGVSFDELGPVERSLLLRKWREVRGAPAVIKRLRGVTTFQQTAWTKEQLGAAYVMTNFALQVSCNPQVERVTFKQWIEAEPLSRFAPRHAPPAAEAAPSPAIVDGMATVGRYKGRVYLLDGYRRAIRFWKTQPSSAVFEVYALLTEQ